MHTSVRRAALGAGLAIALAAPVARAQSQNQGAVDMVARRELMEQAQRAQQTGDHTRALDLAERAGRLQMTTSLRLFIAQEQNALGRIAPALGNADACMREAERDTALRNRDAILSACRNLATQLRARVGRVVVTPPSPAPTGLTITVAGAALNDAFYGVGYPVTPGAVVIEASAPGFAPFRREVEVAQGASVDVSVELTRGGALVATGGTSATTSSTTTSSTAGSVGVVTGPEGPAVVQPARGPSIVGPVVVMAVGGVSLALSGVFFGLREGARSSCPMDLCPDPQTLMRAQDSVNSMTLASNITWIAGGVLLAGGVTWLIINVATRPRSTEAPRTSFNVSPTAGGAVFTLGGAL